MTSKTTNKFSPEVACPRGSDVAGPRGRASVPLGGDHVDRGKIGCTAQTLNEWVKKAEVNSGRKPGLTTDMAAKLKALERENRELRQANEILRKASAYFAQAPLGECSHSPDG